MNELQKVFTYQDKEVRTVVIEGNPWFVAKDVCDILDITNPTVTLERLDDDERAKFNLGRQGETNIVNEAGLYSLVLGSRKPEAKEFKRWITHEVLPAIRAHGGYLTPEKVEEVLLNPDTIIRLATDLKTEREKRREAELIIEKQKPLVGFAKQVASVESTILVRELAKIACKNGVIIGEKRLYNRLREWGMIFWNSTEPKQEYIDRGYFEVVEGLTETNKGTILHKTTRVTGKGQVYIINRLRQEEGIAI